MTTLKLIHSAAHATTKPKQPTSLQLQATPDGLLALMVTDLEAFTTLVDSLGDVEAQTVVQEHNQLVRTCIRRQNGYEIAHTGDGFIAAFRSVIAAIRCASELQLTLADRIPRASSPQLRARIGIHAGEPLHEEERLFGHCVNTAVRVCGHATPGSVLVTEVVEQLARGRVSFGPGKLHKLKGLSRPLRLHRLEGT